MYDEEAIEKVRQGIMRLRELLTIMRQNLEDGERAYAQLFDGVSAEDKATLKEKDQQWNVAEKMVEDKDIAELSRAAFAMRFNARNLELAFTEFNDNMIESEQSLSNQRD